MYREGQRISKLDQRKAQRDMRIGARDDFSEQFAEINRRAAAA